MINGFVLPSLYVLIAKDHTRDREKQGLPRLMPDYGISSAPTSTDAPPDSRRSPS